MIKNILYTRLDINKSIEFLILFILLVFPKINLIKIVYSSHQGLRIEEFAIFFIGLFLIYNRKFEIKKNDLGYNFYLFFLFFLISSILGTIYYDQVFLVILRYVEYLVILIFFNRYNPDTQIVLKVIKSFLILNLIFTLLQYFHLFGEFSSLGYQSPENFDNDRPNGLTGGPWELANMSAILFFAILLFEKDKSISKNIYLIICIFLIIFSISRTVYIAFAISFLFYFYDRVVSKKKFIAVVLSFIVLSIIIFLNFNFIKINQDYFKVFGMVIDLLVHKEVYPLKYYDPKLWSIAARLQHWFFLYEAFLTNNMTILFGSGGIFPYYESTILRILFCTGLVGFFVVLYMIRKMPLYMLIFFIISGITLDLFLSLKIFIATLFYFYLRNTVKKNESRY